jgi:hypothetical protein
MIPHERSLVEKLGNRPFALIGVNSDKDAKKLKQDLTTNQVNWRSFKNQRPGTSASVASSWQVRGYPTLFLIDHNGVIREKWIGNPGGTVIDQKVEELVREAEAAKAKKG